MKALFHTTLTMVFLFCVTNLFAQTADEKKAMEKWMTYMTPGEPHKMMEKANGEWQEEITMWMSPGAKPEKYKASCVNSMIMDGRYQQSIHQGEMNGMPFHGQSIVGYDNAMKKYVSTWIDNMGTGIMYSEGTWDAATKTISFTGQMVDPITGQLTPFREKFTFVDDNNQLMEMFVKQNGEEYQNMQIRFFRAH